MLVVVFKETLVRTETLWQLYGSSVIVQKQFTDMAIQSKTFDSSRYFDFDLRSQSSTLGGEFVKVRNPVYSRGGRHVVAAIRLRRSLVNREEIS